MVGSLVCAALMWTGVKAANGFAVIEPGQFKASAQEPGVLEAEAVSDKPFNEVVPSWNAQIDGGAVLKVSLKAVYPDRETDWYELGAWAMSEDNRSSVKDQKDDDGDVYTDTLALKKPTDKIKVRLTLIPDENDRRPVLKNFYLSLHDSAAWKPQELSDEKLWGRALDVPEKCQGDYEGGGVLCSPTSVSMIMGYWAKTLSRPELAKDVPEIKAGVFDPAWPGTGNWPFNMAFAGSFKGMSAFVTRLESIKDLEKFIEAKIPVAVSVSYDLLKGKDKKGEDDGHLVVVIGFTEAGDPIINDPGYRAQTRNVFPRAQLLRGWGNSHNTCYIVAPSNWKLPAGPGAWPN